MYNAFQTFQKTVNFTFFEQPDDIIGVLTTTYQDQPRSVCLKNEQGVRVTLKERSVDQLWIFWIFPLVERSGQVVRPYVMADWEHLITVSERNSPFLPLEPLTPVNHREDDVHRLAT